MAGRAGIAVRHVPSDYRLAKEGTPMLSMALTFLIVGLVAGLLGLWGVAAVASQIAWVLFLVGVVLIVLHMARAGRLPPAV